MKERIENLDRIIRWLMTDGDYQLPIPPDLSGKQQLMRALLNVRPPRPVSAEFLQWQDQELQLQQHDKGVVTITQPGLNLWRGDITRLSVDAIVNAANSQMLGCFVPLHGCIDNCIHSAAGVQLRLECQWVMQGNELPTGQAVITPAYNLPSRYVIHTVGPICAQQAVPGHDFLPPQEQQQQLADCYANCLHLASEKGLQSIAFCCISTGVFHFPQELAAHIAVCTVRRYLAEHPESTIKTVVFNVFKQDDYDIYQSIIG